jgi:uncharacterized paraquat-inducible protein A
VGGITAMDNVVAIENINQAYKQSKPGCQKCKYQFEPTDSENCAKCVEMIGRNEDE